MGILNMFSRVFIVLIVLLFVGNNIVFANELSDKGKFGYVVLNPTEDDGGITTNTVKKPGKLGNGYGTPSGFRTAVSSGGATSSHSKSYSSSLPTRSTEYSSKDLISNGKVKQRRYYGQEGRAHTDVDYFHGGVGHVFPHRHVWDWGGAYPIRN